MGRGVLTLVFSAHRPRGPFRKYPGQSRLYAPVCGGLDPSLAASCHTDQEHTTVFLEPGNGSWFRPVAFAIEKLLNRCRSRRMDVVCKALLLRAVGVSQVDRLVCQLKYTQARNLTPWTLAIWFLKWPKFLNAFFRNLRHLRVLAKYTVLAHQVFVCTLSNGQLRQNNITDPAHFRWAGPLQLVLEIPSGRTDHFAQRRQPHPRGSTTRSTTTTYRPPLDQTLPTT